MNIQALDLGILEDLDDDFNAPLVIGLSVGLGALFMILVLLTIYFSFFSQGSIFLGSNFNIPGEFDDEQARINDEQEFLPKVTDSERENYFAGKLFQEQFPPDARPLGSTLTEEQQQRVVDRGIQAYFFEQPSEWSSVPSAVIEDKLDVKFTSHEPQSVILNNPLPLTEHDVVYFEVKLLEIPEGSQVSVGVATKPYPLFRLPGLHRYSIAYDSTGIIRVNQPFYSPQIWSKLIEGDIVGCGFKPRSGTIFFTHNGKKVVEAAHNVKFDMFPIIGSQGPSELDVNLGQLGFVFIEANVKKWAFGSVFGTIGIPPAWNEVGDDTVLDKGEELPPNYPSEEDTFFGPSALLTNVEIRPTKVISKPPSYTDEPKGELKAPTPASTNEVSERLYERHSSAFDMANNQYDLSDVVGASSDKLNEPLSHHLDKPLAQEDTGETSTEASAEATPEPESSAQLQSQPSHSQPKPKNKKKAKKKKGKKRK